MYKHARRKCMDNNKSVLYIGVDVHEVESQAAVFAARILKSYGEVWRFD